MPHVNVRLIEGGLARDTIRMFWRAIAVGGVSRDGARGALARSQTLRG
jgi:hypothetical protein